MNNKKNAASSIFIIVALLVSIFTVLPLSVAAADVIVLYPSGTPATDQANIEAAIANIDDGGTIYFAPGTYYANMSINTPDKSFDLVGTGGPFVTTIDGGNNNRVINITSTDINIRGFTFTNGIAADGAGMYINASDTWVVNCVFLGNSASNRGGGMYSTFSNMCVINCIFQNNFATNEGGGLANIYTSGNIFNCTFTNNEAGNSGGGLWNFYSTMAIVDSIFWNNSASTDKELYQNGYTEVLYCDVEGASVYPGTGNINADPLFNADLSLQLGSPCIDTGLDFGINNHDIRDAPRPVDGDATPGAVHDMGAYEYGSTAPYSAYIDVYNVDHCAGTFDAFAYAYGGTPTYNYDWDLDDDGEYDDHAGALLTDYYVGYDWNGTISVRATDGELATTTFETDVSTNPQLTVDLSVEYGPSKAIFTAAASGGDGSYTYDWDLDGDFAYETTGTTSNIQTLLTLSASGTAFVKVNDGEGCWTTASVDYEIRTSWSPAVLKPIVSTMLDSTNIMWGCLLQELPGEVPVDVQTMLDDVQGHMENAAMLSNPVYANGELIKALSLMKQINDALECECHLG